MVVHSPKQLEHERDELPSSYFRLNDFYLSKDIQKQPLKYFNLKKIFTQ